MGSFIANTAPSPVYEDGGVTARIDEDGMVHVRGVASYTAAVRVASRIPTRRHRVGVPVLQKLSVKRWKEIDPAKPVRVVTYYRRTDGRWEIYFVDGTVGVTAKGSPAEMTMSALDGRKVEMVERTVGPRGTLVLIRIIRGAEL